MVRLLPGGEGGTLCTTVGRRPTPTRPWALFVVGVACLASLAGCVELFPDHCETSADCAAGETCAPGLGSRCVRLCARHEDCDDREYCSVAGLFEGESPRCRRGCRDDDGCDADERCVANICRAGCEAGGSGCPSGQYCDPGRGACIEGCDSEASCGEGETCVEGPTRRLCVQSSCDHVTEGCTTPRECQCGNCVSPCEADDDCGSAAEICVAAADPCPSRRCVSAERIMCGAIQCEPWVNGAFDGQTLDACCPAGGGCGVESAFGPCGTVVRSTSGPCGEGTCCAADGFCGVVDSTFGELGFPAVCVPTSGADRAACTPDGS